MTGPQVTLEEKVLQEKRDCRVLWECRDPLDTQDNEELREQMESGD